MTLANVAWATQGRILRGDPDLELAGISTDTRSLGPGELFIALKGDTHDAHTYLESAAATAAAAIIHDESASIRAPQLPIVLAADTTRAYGDLAGWYRTQCPTTLIAITGSNGKTTTKDMLFHVLKGVVCSTRSLSNFNNLIGVPLTLFQMQPENIYAVIEMGTNTPGEIERLCEIADPDIGLITNIGESHLEGLGDVAGVAEEKAALLRYTARRTAAFYNADDYWSRRIAKGQRGTVDSFGIANRADVRAFNVRTDRSGVSFRVKGGPRIAVPVPGAHNASNALAAVAVARKLGIDWDTIAERLASFRLPPMRMETRSVAGVTLINDAYNANPVSLEAAARTLSRMECAGRKILVVGDMLELGAKSEELHHDLGKTIAGFRFDYLLGRGEHAGTLLDAAVTGGMDKGDVRLAGTNEELAATVLGVVSPGDTVLIKGSRGMQLEQVAELLATRLGPATEKPEQAPDRRPERPRAKEDERAAAAPEPAPAALPSEHHLVG